MKNFVQLINNRKFRVAAIAIVLSTITLVSIIITCIPLIKSEMAKKELRKIEKNLTHIVFQTINEITWEIKYTVENNKIISISAQYETMDASSDYYKQNSFRYGDTDAYVRVSHDLKGIPLGGDWYLIECTIIYSDSWNATRIYNHRTTRYEEKLVFNLSEV